MTYCIEETNTHTHVDDDIETGIKRCGSFFRTRNISEYFVTNQLNL